ncbi:hypothetical protein BACCIP111899_01589 [Bacillus rhizoplanae]|uniref:Uncharacterized protein n=1 Tax=Bacillus rhizoplanae TaxID=2880966 RepID=A0ABM8Y9T1_9BACI|nr:hypothetical protein [Bacillus rhizoplanae]CAG9612413.1 hypothetical protein BACCIP111899_01589 [Bacillus rhizoplanae]
MPRKFERNPCSGLKTKYRDRNPHWLNELIKTVKEESPSEWSRIQMPWQTEWQPPRTKRKGKRDEQTARHNERPERRRY